MKPGDIVMGRYRVLRLVGHGGMGAVYRACDDEDDERPVAIKSLRGDMRHLRERFLREARMHEHLRHPAIVECLASGVTRDGELFLVMEWLDGMDLEDRLLQNRLSVREALTLIGRMAEALGVVHKRGMIHRDVKPANVFLPGRDVRLAKLLDFGAARWNAAATLTATGAQIGTPMYMAPEQIRSDGLVGPPADVFALGCLLYECLTGQPAFAAAEIMSVLYMILLDHPPPLNEVLDEVPDAVQALLNRMLAKSPLERFRNGAELAAEITAILDSERIWSSGQPGGQSFNQSFSKPGSQPIDGDSLTRIERRTVSVVVMGGRVSFNEWLHGRARAAPGSKGKARDTQPEVKAALADLFVRYEAAGIRFERLGDGSLLALLSTGRAAGDRAYAGARCAQELRVLFAEKPIAVATGRAVVAHQRVLGDVLDRAISLLAPETSAPLRGIRIDTLTSQLVEARFSVDRSGRHIALRTERKPFGEPQVMGKSTPFVGRRREMAVLGAALDHCIQERQAQAVLITGPPGVGKSRLRREFMRRIGNRPEEVAVWSGRGEPMQTASSLGAIGQILLGMAGIRTDEPLPSRRRKLYRRVSRHLPARTADHVVRFLGEIIDTPWPDEGDIKLRAAHRDPQLMSDQLRLAFVALVRAEAQHHPLIVELEDLHWSDPATVALLDMVLRSLRNLPILILAFARDQVHERFPSIWARRDTTEVKLRPLSAKAADRLVSAVLGRDLDPDYRAQLLARAEGNPLYLEELMRSTAAGRELSPTMLAMIEVRLQALDPDARTVLRAGSVFGERFWPAGVQALVGPDVDVRAAIERLHGEELLLLRPKSKFAGASEFAFRHDLVREAAYQMLTDEDRRLGHQLAGIWLQGAGELDALILAEHFEMGGLRERAIPCFASAAESALEASDLASAVTIAERGVQCGAQGQLLGKLRTVQAEAHVWQGAYRDSITCGEQARALLPVGSSEWYNVAEKLNHACSRLDDLTSAQTLAEELVGGCPAGHDREGWAVLAAHVANILLLFGHMAPSQRLLAVLEREQADLIAENPAVAAIIHTVRAARAAITTGDMAATVHEFRQAVAHYEQVGNLRNACLQQSNMGGAETILGLGEQARTTLRSALERAQQLGVPVLIDGAKQNLSKALVLAGHFDEASRLAEESAHSLERRGGRRLAGFSRIYAATAQLRAGCPDVAEEHISAALGHCAEPSSMQAYALATRACIMRARARLDQAAADASLAMELLDRFGPSEEGDAFIRLTFAEVMHERGDEGRAHEAIVAARDTLLSYAGKIEHAEWRHSFLYNVPENARTLAFAEQLER